jgi:glycerol-3-phosphate dehydrogenase subunit C
MKEGSLQAPERQPIEWQNPQFYDRDALYGELERIFDICHGCRRCVSLCAAFPTLFDLVDESETFEVDGVDKNDYMKVVDQCYLCDLCAETKCPYLPPHEWAVDFPHLMLRAKAYKFKQKDVKWRDRLITSTDPVFRTLSLPGVAQTVNTLARSKPLRRIGEKVVGIHASAPLPTFHSRGFSKRVKDEEGSEIAPQSTDRTQGRVAIFVTCYGEHNEPAVLEDMVAVFNHNDIPVRVLKDSWCCGMPKLEYGDLKRVAAQKDKNLPTFLKAVEDGYDIVAPIPSCVLMYRQEIPLMFPGDEQIKRVKEAFFDPFEYLSLRHRAGLLKTEFTHPLGKLAYHAACHQRVQNIGQRTREVLSLIPETEVTMIERCSGHDGTYAIKRETHDNAMKIARPVVNRVKQAEADHYGSDCPLAGRMIEHGLTVADPNAPVTLHPISMLRKAYGI